VPASWCLGRITRVAAGVMAVAMDIIIVIGVVLRRTR
jgi:hypothetical protein